MITWNNFKCEAPHFSPHRIDNFGDYSQMWCGNKKEYILNCEGCSHNKEEKEMRTDPNNYQEWLRRNNMKEYYEVCDDAKFEEILRSMREQDDYDFENWR